MKYEIIRSKQYLVNTWAHGETTQMVIFPPDGDYSKRAFTWRVSSATVTSEQSSFTPLFGIKRWIMPFDNELLLKHSNNGKPLYQISLKPYETHCFRGDWETESVGMARDFNLMFKEDAYGLMKSLQMLEHEKKRLGVSFPEAFDERIPLVSNQWTLGLYSREGDFTVEMDDTELVCPSEDLLLIHYNLEEASQVQMTVVKNLQNHSQRLVSFMISY